MFREQVSEFHTEMLALYSEKKIHTLGLLAHKAKSSISIMGLDDLAKELKKLENLAREGREPDKYAGIISRFKQETETAVEELNGVLQEIDNYF